jgi:hypothetical protein
MFPVAEFHREEHFLLAHLSIAVQGASNIHSTQLGMSPSPNTARLPAQTHMETRTADEATCMPHLYTTRAGILPAHALGDGS